MEEDKFLLREEGGVRDDIKTNDNQAANFSSTIKTQQPLSIPSSLLPMPNVILHHQF
jgi:hypothetical protein